MTLKSGIEPTGQSTNNQKGRNVLKRRLSGSNKRGSLLSGYPASITAGVLEPK